MPEVTSKDWGAFLERFPETHLLQTPAWGELKAAFGWQPVSLIADSQQYQSGAQILFLRLPLGFSVAYIPKGPVGSLGPNARESAWSQLWPEIDSLCRRKRTIFLKVEPDWWETITKNLSSTETRPLSPPPGFRLSPQTIQPPRTLVIDLRGDEEQLLCQMKQKTRYNIRLAQKKGVVTHPSADVETFYRLVDITSQRDGFGVHNLAYYQRAYEIFHPRGACELLIAEYLGEPLAGLMVFAYGRRAWYLYGGSASQHRDRMPNYLLQWEALRWARSQGCEEYDLWGVPDEEQETLETHFMERSDGLWGVYRFKRGFGGELRRSAGPWDRVYQPAIYAFYRWWSRRKGLAS